MVTVTAISGSNPTIAVGERCGVDAIHSLGNKPCHFLDKLLHFSAQAIHAATSAVLPMSCPVRLSASALSSPTLLTEDCAARWRLPVVSTSR